VRHHDLVHDGKAQAQAVVLARDATIRLAERLEHRWQEVARNTDAGIGHDDFRPCAAARDAKVDAPAFRRELDGVGEQVPHHLLHPRTVGMQAVERRIDVHIDLNPLDGRRRLHGSDRRGGDLTRIDGRAFQLEVTGHDARHVEQRLDELRLPCRVVEDRRARASAAVLSERPLPQHVGPPENRIHGRAQFVGERGEKLILQAVRSLGGLARRPLALEQFTPFGRQPRQFGQMPSLVCQAGPEQAVVLDAEVKRRDQQHGFPVLTAANDDRCHRNRRRN